MRNIISFIIIVLCMVSCQDTLMLDQIKEKNRLVVYAFPTTNDSIIINISVSQPIQGQSKKLSIKSVRCLTNGQDDKVVHNGDSDVYGTTLSTYYAIGKHRSGDEIRIIVNDDNLPMVSATTSIPYRTKIEKMKKDTTFYKGSIYTRMRLSLTDNEQSTYYAIRMIGMYAPEDETIRGKTEFVELETSTEPILNNYSNAELELGSWNDYYHKMYIFDDYSFKNKGVILHLCTLQKSWLESYKTQLFALSPEYYFLLKSLNDIKNNDIGANGLSFMFSTYTNVQDGYGCVAGYCMDETGWLK